MEAQGLCYQASVKRTSKGSNQVTLKVADATAEEIEIWIWPGDQVPNVDDVRLQQVHVELQAPLQAGRRVAFPAARVDIIDVSTGERYSWWARDSR